MARGAPERRLPRWHTFDSAIPNDQFDRIGKVAAAWSHLEATLDDLIWHFLDLCDEDGRIITSSMDAATLKTIEDLRLDRNFIIHGVWGSIAPAKRLAAALSFCPKAPPGQVALETFPPIRVTSIADGIDQARFQIMVLTRQLQPYAAGATILRVTKPACAPHESDFEITPEMIAAGRRAFDSFSLAFKHRSPACLTTCGKSTLFSLGDNCRCMA